MRCFGISALFAAAARWPYRIRMEILYRTTAMHSRERSGGEREEEGGGVGCDSLGIRIIQVLCLQERRIVPSSRCSFDPLLRVRGPRCAQPTNAFVFVPEQLLSARCASVAKTRAEPRVDLAEKKKKGASRMEIEFETTAWSLRSAKREKE